MGVQITETVSADACVAAGFPDPDLDPRGWIDCVRYLCAAEVETGMDFDEANAIIRIAIARAHYIPPAPSRPFSDLELQVLGELAA